MDCAVSTHGHSVYLLVVFIVEGEVVIIDDPADHRDDDRGEVGDFS